ncbi:hypothetical protein [Alienimonas californiensis]|uniref:Adenosine monophosphate-protein transferase VopS n=1 Tax=Alienimonas californiensis TaxID=2527989 RepID=A0A517P4D9_9PLAN|nr:hypothetical protein [Alienimonas californiensis]QDT14262.1 Adenosine monophosphate-protein transferase VopS [Alienimonas californiensis]
MGLFTSDKVKWRRSIRDDRTAGPKFERLARSVGRPTAKKFLELVYDKAKSNKMDVNSSIIKDFAGDFCDWEREAVEARWQYITSLIPRVQSDELTRLLNDNVRDPNDYQTGGAGGATVRERAIDKATHWLCGDYAPARPAAKALLEQYIPAHGDGPAGPSLGRNMDHLKRIHQRLAPNVAPERMVYFAQRTAYPSTVGGRYLVERMFQTVSNPVGRPAVGNDRWKGIAMFYMAAIVTAQAFTDANKRAGHAAYAIILIKGLGDFHAPTVRVENALFQMG